LQKINTRVIAEQGIVAAVYAALCLALAPISYGENLIEFRLAEMLLILLYFDKRYAFGLTVGCFVANMFSPLGIYDMVFGTAATAIVCFSVSFLHGKSKKYLIGVVAAVVNGFIIGTMLWLLVPEVGAPIWIWMLSIFAGQIVVVELAAVFCAVFIEKNPVLVDFLTNGTVRGADSVKK
jgi:uncharacterized membrane protein